MGLQLAKYDPSGPGAPASDRIVSRLLHEEERVQAAGYGDLLLPPFIGRHRGKMFVTTWRLIVVPDQSRFPYPFWWRPWAVLNDVQLRGSMWSSRVTFAERWGDDLRPLGVDTTRALAREMARACGEAHAQPIGRGDWGSAVVLESGKFCCLSCGFNPDDPLRCGACGRRLHWDGVLGRAAAAAHDPDSVLPESFPDGGATQRGPVLQSLATFAAAATVERQHRYLENLDDLLSAMGDRRPQRPETFGVMPILESVPDHENNQTLWDFVCKYPQRLATAPTQVQLILGE